MSNIDHYHHGIIRVKVPVPFPLQWVNSYILQDDSGYVVIDPGLHTEAAEQMWRSALEELNIEPQQIRKIILTHHHPDHYGLAGWMQQWSGCDVFMSEAGHKLARRLWGEQETMTEELTGLFATHGLSPDKLQQLREHMQSFIPLVSPQPEVRYIKEGDNWQAGQLSFRTVSVSGHAYNHLCFIDESHKLMLCGDHILPRITPNISYMPNEDPDPLHSFLEGLGKLSAYHINEVFPGHRDPFQNLQSRVHDLKIHHERRLTMMLEQLGEPSTAYELCTKLFGTRLSIHQLRFAMSETLAHLIYLQKRRYVSVQEVDGLYRYTRLAPYFTE